MKAMIAFFSSALGQGQSGVFPGSREGQQYLANQAIFEYSSYGNQKQRNRGF
jgi:hypothetical protein